MLSDTTSGIEPIYGEHYALRSIKKSYRAEGQNWID
jgi:hypothetical protein